MPRYPVDQRIKVPGHIPFGSTDPNAKHGYHAGDDSANSTGTPVYAPASGSVYSVADSGNQGIAVQIFDGKYYPHVFHLSKRVVNPGQPVTEGGLIGHTGNTGLSSGPHIHFGVGKVPYLNSKSINDYIDPMEYVKGGDIVKPTEAQVYDSFRRFALREPDNPEQVQYYMNRDIRDLYSDLLNYEVIPKKAEVEDAFKKFSATPVNTPPNTDQTGYYSNRAAKQLYLDLCNDLKKRLDAAGGDVKVLLKGKYEVK